MFIPAKLKGVERIAHKSVYLQRVFKVPQFYRHSYSICWLTSGLSQECDVRCVVLQTSTQHTERKREKSSGGGEEGWEKVWSGTRMFVDHLSTAQNKEMARRGREGREKLGYLRTIYQQQREGEIQEKNEYKMNKIRHTLMGDTLYEVDWLSTKTYRSYDTVQHLWRFSWELISMVSPRPVSLPV